MKSQAHESEYGQVNIDCIISTQSIGRDKSPSRHRVYLIHRTLPEIKGQSIMIQGQLEATMHRQISFSFSD